MMNKDTCNCAYKQSLIDRMQEHLRAHPDGSARWVELLFGKDSGANEHPLCCLLTFLFYYAFCEENTMTVSEMARHILEPLMNTKSED